MALATAPVSTYVPISRPGSDGRIFIRHQCNLPTTCQPLAARGPDDPHWEARIRNISAGGIGLSAVRRFERGTGLAIEIPEEGDYLGDTLLARVVHVVRLPGGSWLLGCAFVSALSEDTVARLVRLRQAQVDAAKSAPQPIDTDGSAANQNSQNGGLTTAIPHVLWCNRETGKRQIIRRLLTAAWPLLPQATLKLWVKNATGERHSTQMVVHSCEKQGENWVVYYSTVAEPVAPLSRWPQRG